jgi:hypothetical protein
MQFAMKLFLAAPERCAALKQFGWDALGKTGESR